MPNNYTQWYKQGNKSDIPSKAAPLSDIEAKLDKLYFKGLYQDKCLIYED